VWKGVSDYPHLFLLQGTSATCLLKARQPALSEMRKNVLCNRVLGKAGGMFRRTAACHCSEPFINLSSYHRLHPALHSTKSDSSLLRVCCALSWQYDTPCFPQNCDGDPVELLMVRVCTTKTRIRASSSRISISHKPAHHLFRMACTCISQRC